MNQTISSLDLPKDVITKLKNCGFNYCNDLKEDPNIQQKINIPNWPLIIEAPATKTALELCQEESLWTPITTFNSELDSLLKDEITPGLVTELTGFPGAGKTQLCYHLSVGVYPGETFFISTNKTFAPHRLREIAHGCIPHHDVESVLEKIQVLEAADPVELLAGIRLLETWLPNHENIKLLIIDSISWPMKQKPVTERTSLIYTIFQSLRILANSHKFAIVVTNDLTTRINGSRVYNTPALGDSFHHIVNNRILLTKENNLRKAKILKSTQNGCVEVQFNFQTF